MKILNKCSIIEASDLEESKLRKTVDKLLGNPKKIFLLGIDVKEKLNKIIEKINDFCKSKDEEINLTSYRLAYEIEFIEKVTLYVKDTKEKIDDITKLSNLLEKIDYDDNFSVSRKYLVVINDEKEINKNNIKTEISNLLQQFVFLNLDIDVCRYSDIKRKEIKDDFRENYKNIKKSFDDFSKNFDDFSKKIVKKIVKLSENNKSREFFENKITIISEALENLQEQLANAEARPIRIAVMGSKKAGKSVIINCLLNCDYAPTSLELPTPNNITYKPYKPTDDKNVIYFKYENDTKEFKSSNELKNVINTEFKKAQDAGSDLDDMIIHYPSNDLTGFEIIDTPGPNFAGAGKGEDNKHQKKAYEALMSADVCIFVIDYAKHLATDEEIFLTNICKCFENNQKFYSLFIAINRIDERFANKDEKSVIRIVDMIHDRLQKLNYNNLTLFGTSALQSFYIEQVRQLLFSEKVYSLEDIDESWIKKLKKKYKNKDDEMTVLSFVGHSLTQMEDFYDYEEPNGSQLNWLSGIPQLKKYTCYIGEEKADTEIVNHAIDVIDKKIKIISNNLQTSEIQKIANDNREELKKLLDLLENFKNQIGIIFHKLKIAVDEKDRSDINKKIKQGIEEIFNHNYKNCEVRLRSELKKIKFNNNNIGYYRSFLNDIQNFINSKIIHSYQKETCDEIPDITDEIKEYTDRVKKTLFNSEKEIRDEVKKIENQLKERSVKTLFHDNFQLPIFPTELNSNINFSYSDNRNLIIDNLIKIKDENTKNTTEIYFEDVPRDPEGFWEHICAFFGKEYTKQVRREKKITTYDFTQINQKIDDIFCSYLKNLIYELDNVIREDIEEKIDGHFNQILAQVEEVKDDYKKMTQGFIDDIKFAIDDKKEEICDLEKDIRNLEALNRQISSISSYFLKYR